MNIFNNPNLPNARDWPHDQSYGGQCCGCGAMFAGPKRANKCWECLSDVWKSHWLGQNDANQNNTGFTMTSSTITATIEEATPQLRFVERALRGHIKRILQQKWLIRTEGSLSYEEEWRDVPMERNP